MKLFRNNEKKKIVLKNQGEKAFCSCCHTQTRIFNTILCRINEYNAYITLVKFKLIVSSVFTV